MWISELRSPIGPHQYAFVQLVKTSKHSHTQGLILFLEQLRDVDVVIPIAQRRRVRLKDGVVRSKAQTLSHSYPGGEDEAHKVFLTIMTQSLFTTLYLPRSRAGLSPASFCLGFL